jgi:hypothetical protein
MSFKSIRWQHVKSGKVYKIVGFGLEESTLTPVVIYEGKSENGEAWQTWTRPCWEFFDGRFQMAGEIGDSDKKSHGWQGQLIPKITTDADKRSLVIGDYVTLYVSTAENRRVWGPHDRRKIVDIVDDTVKLQPLDEIDDSHAMWEASALKYAGGTEDGTGFIAYRDGNGEAISVGSLVRFKKDYDNGVDCERYKILSINKLGAALEGVGGRYNLKELMYAGD